jgi:hypothetical protein
MKPAYGIACLFLDIGGVLLTDAGHMTAGNVLRRTSIWTWPRWKIGIT